MKRHKLNGLDCYIIYCITACVLYCIAEMIVSSITGITHDSLTVAWYGFHGSEVFCACFIKRMKLKQGGEQWNGTN